MFRKQHRKNSKEKKNDNNLRNVTKGEGAAGESRGALCLSGRRGG